MTTMKHAASNDNKHDHLEWNFMHDLLGFWLDCQNIPFKKWPYNRSIHYMYELMNRPWLDREIRKSDIMVWLRKEARLLGYSPRFLNDADLRRI